MEFTMIETGWLSILPPLIAESVILTGTVLLIGKKAK